jgi:signal transduction histidine kinase
MPKRGGSDERKRTDQKLRTERQKTDDELVRRGEGIEAAADEVIRRARERADRVLEAARAQADARPETMAQPEAARTAVGSERRAEDDTVARERAHADEVLERERAEHRRALASLLALERGETDRALINERALSDEAITAREEVLGIVSHDLRTLLGGISLATALLIKEASDDEAGHQTIRRAEVIQRHSLRMNRLIGDLVDIASIEARRLTVVAEPSDPLRVLKEAIDAFRDAASERAIALELEVAGGDVPRASFDHERILQVLANLLGNALKFTEKGGRVLLRVEARDGDLLFSVKDNGAGVPADIQPTIFERFWQAKKADRRGLGLGLFISKAIIEAHGGRIWVESQVGMGSTFYFTLLKA